MKKFSKIFSVIVIVLTVLVFLGAAAMVVPKWFGYYPYIVLSGSMEPNIQTGALAIVDANDTDVEVGDIVTYALSSSGNIGIGNGRELAAKDGTFVTHRIVDTYGNGWYITQGDANEGADANPVSEKQIVGTFLFSIPKLGRILNNLGSTGIIIIIGAMVGLNIASILFSYATKEDDEESDDEEGDDIDNLPDAQE